MEDVFRIHDVVQRPSQRGSLRIKDHGIKRTYKGRWHALRAFASFGNVLRNELILAYCTKIPDMLYPPIVGTGETDDFNVAVEGLG